MAGDVELTARRSIEWPTLAVAAAIAGAFGSLLAAHEHLPVVAQLAALALAGAWYNSLQHEVVHGHPTPWRRFNTALALLPLGLVVPFGTYRATHLAHHRTAKLTDPVADPESFYVTEDAWQAAGRLRRLSLNVLSTLAGRLVFGPPVMAVQWWWRGRTTFATRAGAVSAAGHAVAVAAVLTVVAASGMPLWVYAVGVAWGGGALTLLRSFAEHRLPDDGTRSAVVRSNWFFSLLFLNNNLHHTHHALSRLAWYRLPRAHDRLGSDEIAARGAGFYRGYGEITRRYLVRPLDDPATAAIPSATAPAPASA